eukprot:scaffold39283_cov63-Phaeocystis_antarctica.AAC.1
MREVEPAVDERHGVIPQPEIASGVDVRLRELGDTDVQHRGHAMRAPQPIAHTTHVSLREVSGWRRTVRRGAPSSPRRRWRRTRRAAARCARLRAPRSAAHARVAAGTALLPARCPLCAPSQARLRRRPVRSAGRRWSWEVAAAASPRRARASGRAPPADAPPTGTLWQSGAARAARRRGRGPHGRRAGSRAAAAARGAPARQRSRARAWR